MALFYKEPNSPPSTDLAGALGVASVPPLLQPTPPHPPVLDLALPKVPRTEPPHPLLQTPAFFCSPAAIAATAALPKVKVYKRFVSCIDYTAPNDVDEATTLSLTLKYVYLHLSRKFNEFYGNLINNDYFRNRIIGSKTSTKYRKKFYKQTNAVVRFPAVVKILSLLINVPTGARVHTATCSVNTTGCLSGRKEAGV
jgi:hypothetical protein